MAWSDARERTYARSEIASLGAASLGIAVAGDRGDPETMPTRARYEAAHAVVALAHWMTVHSADIQMRVTVSGQAHWSAPDRTSTAPREGPWTRIAISVHGPGPDDIQNAMLCAMKIICIGRRPQAYPSGGLTVEGTITGATTEAVRILDQNAAAVDRIQTMLLEGNTTRLRSADLAEIEVVRARARPHQSRRWARAP